MEDTLTVARLAALMREWKRHPPLPLLVAAFMGINPEEESSPELLVERLQGLPGIVVC